jgi:hypothetical protein
LIKGSLVQFFCSTDQKRSHYNDTSKNTHQRYQQARMLLLRQANHATGGLPESDPLYGGSVRPTAGVSMHELPADHLLRMQQQNQPMRLWKQCMGRHALRGKHGKRDIRSYHGLTNRF